MSAVVPPTKHAILSLYHNMLRSSQSFASYNFREYFTKKTKDTFREMQVRVYRFPCLRIASLTRTQLLCSGLWLLHLPLTNPPTQPLPSYLFLYPTPKRRMRIELRTTTERNRPSTPDKPL